MESHPYEINGGAGTDLGTDSALSTAVDTNPDVQPRVRNTCQHLNAKGGRCRMVPKVNCRFCKRHQPASPPTADELAAELLGADTDFSTASGVNLFLGNLVKQFAHRRVERRDAITLAYLGQLLLNSLAALDRQDKLDSNRRPTTIIFDMPGPDDDPRTPDAPSPNAGPAPATSQQSWR